MNDAEPQPAFQLLQNAEHNLLRTLIDNMPDFFYVKDTEGRFLLNNAAHIRLTGAKTPDEILHRTDFDFSRTHWRLVTPPTSNGSWLRVSRSSTTKSRWFTRLPESRSGPCRPKFPCVTIQEESLGWLE
ncbi:MAG: hypothetical protein HZY76_14115 [Anaerolineae bacterium]|nr:MAG: hypothetical protein HZY76_14115 [Anaerolineae bacterium]